MTTHVSSILNYLIKRTILNLLPTFFLILLPLFTLSQSTTVNFNYTGSSQNWVVPYCVSSITITGAGASGGGSNGGDGALILCLQGETPRCHIPSDCHIDEMRQSPTASHSSSLPS